MNLNTLNFLVKKEIYYENENMEEILWDYFLKIKLY